MQELKVPEELGQRPDVREIARILVQPDGSQNFVLEATFQEPRAWGLIAAELLRTAANAYEARGEDWGKSFEDMLRTLFRELNKNVEMEPMPPSPVQ